MQRRIAAFVAILGVLPVMLAAQEPQAAEPPAQPGAPTVTAGQVMTSIRQRIDQGTLTPEEARRSVEFLRALLQRNPNDVQATLLLGDLLLESDAPADYQQARTLFRQVLAVEPNNFRANLGMGKIWLATRSPRQAASFLEAAQRVAPPDKLGETRRMLAIAYAGMGNPTQAVVKAEEAVQAAPEDLDSLSVLIEMRLQAGQTDPQQLDAALRDAERYVQRAARAAEAASGQREPLERLRTALQLHIGALREYHQSLYQRNLQGQPTDELRRGQETAAAAALVRIADTMRRLSSLQQVLTEHDTIVLLERALEYDPRNVQHLESLAAAYERVESREAAIATYRRILELHPDHAEAKQALGDMGASPPETSTADEDGSRDH